MSHKVACVQVNATDDMMTNVKKASDLVKQAVFEGADWVLLPENVAYMSTGYTDLANNLHSPGDLPALSAFAKLARDNGI